MIKFKEGKELSPGIVVYENVIENPQRFIDIALNINQWQEPKIKSGNALSTNSAVKREYRNCSTLELETSFRNPKEWFELAQIIFLYGNHYAETYTAYFASMEMLQMVRYYPVNNFYKIHADSGPRYPRVISAVLYLNDVAEGGETYFDRFNVSIKPKAGNLLMFPSEFLFTHEGKPPISGEKFIVATWFNPVLGDHNHE